MAAPVDILELALSEAIDHTSVCEDNPQLPVGAGRERGGREIPGSELPAPTALPPGLRSS